MFHILTAPKTCLVTISPSHCPLCRKLYNRTLVKKLHMDAPQLQSDPNEDRLTQQLSATDSNLDSLISQVQSFLEEKAEDAVCNRSLQSSIPHTFTQARPLRLSLPLLTRLRDVTSLHDSLSITHTALQDMHTNLETTMESLRSDLSRQERHLAVAVQERDVSKGVEQNLLQKIAQLESQLADTRKGRGKSRVKLDSPPGSRGKGKYTESHNPLPSPPMPVPTDLWPSSMRDHIAESNDYIWPAPSPRRAVTEEEVTRWDHAKQQAGPSSRKTRKHRPSGKLEEALRQAQTQPPVSGYPAYLQDSPEDDTRMASSSTSRPHGSRHHSNPEGLSLSGLHLNSKSAHTYQPPFYPTPEDPPGHLPGNIQQAFVDGYSQGYTQSQVVRSNGIYYQAQRSHAGSSSIQSARDPSYIYAAPITAPATPASVYATPASHPGTTSSTPVVHPQHTPQTPRRSTYTASGGRGPIDDRPGGYEETQRRVSFNAVSPTGSRMMSGWGTPSDSATVMHRSSTGSDIMYTLQSFPANPAGPFPVQEEDSDGTPQARPSWLSHASDTDTIRGPHRESRQSRRRSGTTTPTSASTLNVDPRLQNLLNDPVRPTGSTRPPSVSYVQSRAHSTAWPCIPAAGPSDNALGLNIDASSAWAPTTGGIAAPTPRGSNPRFLRDYD